MAGAAEMMSRGGLGHTSVREIARHAGTPLGSTYHYFPDGKAQLARETIQFAGGKVSRALGNALERGPVEGLEALLAWWRQVLANSDYDAGCPVMSVAVTESRFGDMVDVIAAARHVFADWEHQLAGSLIARGASSTQAENTATLVVCAVEGAIGLCRVEGSTRPLDAIDIALRAALTRTLEQRDGA
jgi:AcrR family transcriptional regulator